MAEKRLAHGGCPCPPVLLLLPFANAAVVVAVAITAAATRLRLSRGMEARAVPCRAVLRSRLT